MADDDLADDLMEGINKIAVFTGIKPRRLFYLAEKGHLPIFKVGDKWCGRKSTLRAHFAKLEQRAGAA